MVEEALADFGVGKRDDACGKECGILSSVDTDGGDWDPRGHLDGGEEGVDALQRARRDGDADDGAGRVSRDNAGQMGCHAGARDEDFDPELLSRRDVFGGLVGGTMSGQDPHVAGNVQGIENVAPLEDHRKVARTARHRYTGLDGAGFSADLDCNLFKSVSFK